MVRRYHLPTQLNWNIEPPVDEVARLQGTVLSAIRHAIESISSEAPEIVVTDFAIRENASERFAVSRYRAERNTYAVPSYNGGGASTEVPVEEITFEDEEITSLMRLHPAGEVAEDRVIPGRSPFEGQLVAIFPRWEAVRVRSERYAISTDLRRAVVWGQLLFGARSYVILEGPFGRPNAHYYVLGTTHALHAPAGARGTGFEVAEGHEVWGMPVRYWELEHRDGQGNSYLVRALFAAEGNEILPNVRLAEEFYNELSLGASEGGVIPIAMARSLVFDEINRMIDSGNIEEASRRLAELDAHAYLLVDWQTKAKYLGVLIDAWTSEPQEIAIVEIIKSIDNRSALSAALGRLRQAGLFDQLFADLDSQIWSLLVAVGERFGDPGPITFSFLVELLQQAGLLPRNLGDVARGIVIGPAGPIIGTDLLAEIEEAARGFVRFLGGTLESIWMLISEPEKVIEGIGQLVKLTVMVQLAQLGYPPAIQYVGNILQNMVQQVVHGLKGAHLLGITGDILRRIKWAIIWEVASWFIGVGEIKAILTGVGLTERIAAIARILRIIGLVGRATEAERIAGKLERLARIMSRASRVLGHEDEALRILSHLPENEISRLTRALEVIDIDEAMDMARVQQLLGEASDTLRHAETLGEFAAKAGGLSDEVVDAFNILVNRSQIRAEALAGIVGQIPQGEGGRFARAIRTLPESSFGPSGLASNDFLRVLAGSPGRMNALADIGYESFMALYRRGGQNAETMDQYLNALADLERRLPAETRATEYRRLLDRLERGENQAWAELEDVHRSRFAVEPAAEAARQTFRQVYKQLEQAGLLPAGPSRAIWPDPARYPTVEIRPNGDLLGTYTDVRRYVQEMGLSARRRVGESTLEVHHLMEDRLMEQFGIRRGEGRSVALEADDHHIFSAEVPRYMPRSQFFDIDDIFEAHARVYRDHGHAEWIDEMEDFLRKNREQIRGRYERAEVPGAKETDFQQRKQRVFHFLDRL